MIKKNYFSIIALGALLLLGACSKKDTPNPSQNSNDPKIILNTNSKQLSQRISTDSAGVLRLYQPLNSIARDHKDDSTAYHYPLALIATVAPPEYKGHTLQATHVDINGNYAYVSYNVKGPTYLGGIEVIDISNAAAPEILEQAILPSTDISAVVYDPNHDRLYGAGASDMGQNSDLTSPGVWGYVNLQNGALTSDLNLFNIAGQVGTDIAVQGGKIYVTSGDEGTFKVFNEAGLDELNSFAIGDLRSVAVSSESVAVLSGTEGVKVLNAQNYNNISSFNFGPDIPESKRTMDFNGNNLVIAGGKKGIEYYNATTGSQINSIPLLGSMEGIDPDDIVTNAVSNNDGLILAANGAAGVYACEEEQGKLALVGAIDLSGSANYVKSKGDYIFVATGTGGLKILKIIRPEGAFTSCDSYPQYEGNKNLNVNSGQDLKYSGSAALENVNVNSKLTFCGAMTVYNSLNINSDGLFNLRGTLMFGKGIGYNNNLIINQNATLYIDGSLTIYGNLIMNGGTLKIADGSTVTVYGNVTRNDGSKIVGDNFTATYGKINKN